MLCPRRSPASPLLVAASVVRSPLVAWALVATSLVACGGRVVLEEPSGAGGGGAGIGGADASTAAATGPSAETSAGGGAASSGGSGATEVGAGIGGGEPGPGGGAGGGDVVGEACDRFCEAHGEPCETFQGDCRRECALVAATFGCEPEWIAALRCLADEDVTCVDVSACDGPIDVWNACLEG